MRERKNQRHSGGFLGRRGRQKKAGKGTLQPQHALRFEALEPRAMLATWSGLGPDNNIGTPGNWVGGAVPGSTDAAIFPPGTGTLQVTAPTALGSLDFQGDGAMLQGSPANPVVLGTGIVSVDAGTAGVMPYAAASGGVAATIVEELRKEGVELSEEGFKRYMKSGKLDRNAINRIRDALKRESTALWNQWKRAEKFAKVRSTGGLRGGRLPGGPAAGCIGSPSGGVAIFYMIEVQIRSWLNGTSTDQELQRDVDQLPDVLIIPGGGIIINEGKSAGGFGTMRGRVVD